MFAVRSLHIPIWPDTQQHLLNEWDHAGDFSWQTRIQTVHIHKTSLSRSQVKHDFGCVTHIQWFVDNIFCILLCSESRTKLINTVNDTVDLILRS